MAPPGPDTADGRLETVLEEAARIFQEITALCMEQRTALLANDAGALARLNERAETLAARFRLLESARCELTAAAAPAPTGGEGGPISSTGSATSGTTSAGRAVVPASSGSLASRAALDAAHRRLVEEAASAALAAAGNAEILARASAATSAIRRVLEGAVSAGYLPSGEHRVPPSSSVVERRA